MVARLTVVDTTVEIAAPVSSVWKAISEGGELARWFPLEARVTPGEGGEVFMSWGAPWEGRSRIDAWEPERRLRTRSFLEHGDASMVEYTLEARGGKTMLRLVHSGFAPGGDWEDELFAGNVRGWPYELRSLRHYLERHAGSDRRALWPRVPVRGTAADVWRRLLGRDGRGASLHPRLPAVAEQRRFVDGVAHGPLVVRWMLHAGFGYDQAREHYAPFDRLVDEDVESRANVAALILDHLRLRRPVIFVANNKAEGSAPLTVFRLAETIARGSF